MNAHTDDATAATAAPWWHSSPPDLAGYNPVTADYPETLLYALATEGPAGTLADAARELAFLECAEALDEHDAETIRRYAEAARRVVELAPLLARVRVVEGATWPGALDLEGLRAAADAPLPGAVVWAARAVAEALALPGVAIAPEAVAKVTAAVELAERAGRAAAAYLASTLATLQLAAEAVGAPSAQHPVITGEIAPPALNIFERALIQAYRIGDGPNSLRIVARRLQQIAPPRAPVVAATADNEAPGTEAAPKMNAWQEEHLAILETGGVAGLLADALKSLADDWHDGDVYDDADGVAEVAYAVAEARRLAPLLDTAAGAPAGGPWGMATEGMAAEVVELTETVAPAALALWAARKAAEALAVRPAPDPEATALRAALALAGSLAAEVAEAITADRKALDRAAAALDLDKGADRGRA